MFHWPAPKQCRLQWLPCPSRRQAGQLFAPPPLLDAVIMRLGQGGSSRRQLDSRLGKPPTISVIDIDTTHHFSFSYTGNSNNASSSHMIALPSVDVTRSWGSSHQSTSDRKCHPVDLVPAQSCTAISTPYRVIRLMSSMDP